MQPGENGEQERKNAAFQQKSLISII